MNEQTIVTTAPATPPSLFKRISWGAIFAGLITTLVAQMTFTLLGAAIGAATINPAREDESLGGLALGTGIWLIATGLVSIYLGACVAGRLSGGPSKADGMLHGFVSWGTATLVTALLLTTAIGNLFGGAIGLVSRAFTTGQDAGMAPMMSGVLQGSSIEVPEAAQLAAKDPQLGVSLARMFAHGGAQASGEYREQVISILVSRHGMTQAQAANAVERWQRQYQQIRAEAQQQGQQIGQAAAEGISRAALWGFIAMVLGAAVAAWGGWSGAASVLKVGVVRRDVRAPA